MKYVQIVTFYPNPNKPGRVLLWIRYQQVIAEIVKLADVDLSGTNVFAKIAVRQILKSSMSELPKKLTISFELEQEKIRYEG